MDRGKDFLIAQVNNAVGLHTNFLDALESHADQAEDQRYAALCRKYIPMMQGHRSMLEQYQEEVGGSEGMMKKAMGAVMGKARDLADMTRESDFLRLVQDIVMSRQLEDTFKTFREAGRQLGMTSLAQLGEQCEREHDEYNRDASRLVQQLFVEHVRDEDPAKFETRSRIDTEPRASM